MKKCKGCGEVLQTEDIKAIGYTPNIEFDYCQRCFRLVHYGDNSKVNSKSVSNNKIYDFYNKHSDALYVLIIDIFDFFTADIDNFLKSIKHDYILIINKIDLLPINFTNDKIDNILNDILSRSKTKYLLDCLLTYKDDIQFNDLFIDTINKYEYKDLLFIGRTNAGKSTIINKLINDNKLTTSIYGGTSTNLNVVEHNGYNFIDTPGLFDEDNIINYLDKEKIKYITPKKTIKERTYQFYENVSYIVEGLCSFNFEPHDNCSISFLICNELEIHRTKIDNHDNYIVKNSTKFNVSLLPFNNNSFFSIKNDALFIIKGLGLVRVKGNCNLNVMINDKIRLFKKEDILDANW